MGNILRPNHEFDKVNKEIKNIKIKDSFKPHLWQTLYTKNSKSGSYWTVPCDKELMLSKIETYHNGGIEGISFVVYVGYKEGNLYYQTSLDRIEEAMNKCDELGMEIPFIKFHQEYGINNIFEMGEDKFKSQFKQMVREVCERFKDRITYIGLFNEWQHFYGDVPFKYNDNYYDYRGFVIECIQLAQSYGLKASVSVAGISPSNWGSWSRLDDSIKEICDVYMFNMYYSVGIKEEKTTLLDVQECIKYHESNETFSDIKDVWGDKPIIITETGIMKWWYNFYTPAATSLQNGIDSNGKTYELMLEGILSTLKDYDNIIGVNWWYNNAFLEDTENLRAIVDKYIVR